MDSVDVIPFHHQILDWWRAHGRVLPWRERRDSFDFIPRLVRHSAQDDIILRERAFRSYFAGKEGRDPYRVIVAELMLQQTQVERVLPKYQAWMTKWPTIQDLANTTLAEVLIEWKGLGYNRRAKFLWQLAQTIATEYHGQWPQTEKELLNLPGIGQYTARAVLSFSFNKQVAVVDTNVKRVIKRWFSLIAHEILERGPSTSVSLRSTSAQDDVLKEKQWFALADSLLPDHQADPWNQALMDFGALICSARRPQCTLCPVSNLCQVNQLAIQQGFANYAEYLSSLPVEPKKTHGKDAGKKFEETDRYVRGKIVDILREKKVTELKLVQELAIRFNLHNQEQIANSIQQLLKEGMIEKEKGKLSLP